MYNLNHKILKEYNTKIRTKKSNKWKTVIHMVALNATMSIIIVNVNWLNTSFKMQRLFKWITKQTYVVYTKPSLNISHRLNVKEWRKVSC